LNGYPGCVLCRRRHKTHNHAEHYDALAALDRLMEIDPESGTPAADDLQLLALVFEDYEKARRPIGLPDPVDAIRFCMDP